MQKFDSVRKFTDFQINGKKALSAYARQHKALSLMPEGVRMHKEGLRIEARRAAIRGSKCDVLASAVNVFLVNNRIYS